MKEDVKYKSTLKNVVQDEDHIQFDFEHTPIDVPPKNNEKDLRIAQLETRVSKLEKQMQLVMNEY